jgi:hypothetical protein
MATKLLVDLQSDHERRRLYGVLLALREKQRKCKYEVVIKERRGNRSAKANAYYWAVVMPAAARGLTDSQGETYDEDRAHEFFKTLFLGRPVINRRTGERLATMPGSSAVLDTAQYAEFVEQVRTWLAEYCGVSIPDPSAFRDIETQPAATAARE